MAEFDSFPADIHPANYEMKKKPKDPAQPAPGELLAIPSLDDCL